MYILSIDPGYTTGICIASTTDEFKVIEVGDVRWDKYHKALHTLLSGKYVHQDVPLTFDFVIVEQFRLRHSKAMSQVGQTFPSVKVISAVETFLWLYNRANALVFQEPSQQARVKILDKHKDLVKGSEHKKDAYRHARYFYVTEIRKRVSKET